jgi:hypothetical protein
MYLIDEVTGVEAGVAARLKLLQGVVAVSIGKDTAKAPVSNHNDKLGT